jgi:hypothetical protein
MPRRILTVIVNLIIEPVECGLVVVGDDLLKNYVSVSNKLLLRPSSAMLPPLANCDQVHSLSIHLSCKLALFPET